MNWYQPSKVYAPYPGGIICCQGASRAQVIEMREWCRANCRGEWVDNCQDVNDYVSPPKLRKWYGCFFFKDKKKAAMFKLMFWSW